jgi:hypothetical protein
MGDAPRQVAPLLHLPVPEEHLMFEVGVDWPAGSTVADLERGLIDLGWLPLPGDRVDRIIARISAGNGLWRFSAPPDWRRRSRGLRA